MSAADAGAADAPAFPWDAVLGFLFGTLRLAPAAAWTMTPREAAMAIRPFVGAATAAGPPGRPMLDALMQRFPDGG